MGYLHVPYDIENGYIFLEHLLPIDIPNIKANLIRKIVSNALAITYRSFAVTLQL
jgi:hypothetical protein